MQAPASAKFDGMPRSAIDAGLADVVAPGRGAARQDPRLSRSTPRSSPGPSRRWTSKTQSALEKICHPAARRRPATTSPLYKKSTVYRRIERRMGLHQIDKIADYVRYLQENPQEMELLFKELLIGVTSFFRDPAAWEQLQEQGHPGAARRAARRRAAAGLGARLLDRRGGLLPGHGLQGGAGAR